MYHNVQCSIYHRILFKLSDLVRHRRVGHKIPCPSNFITNATDYLSPLSSFSNCDDTIVDSAMVHYEATNLNSGTGKSISGTDISSETA